MPFEKKTAVAEAVGKVYGEYDSTFVSDGGQVRADLFRQRDSLVAYISFLGGRSLQDVTDNYIAALERHASEAGFPGRLRIKYSEN